MQTDTISQDTPEPGTALGAGADGAAPTASDGAGGIEGGPLLEEAPLLEEELLVEEVSIDGMCGVY